MGEGTKVVVRFVAVLVPIVAWAIFASVTVHWTIDRLVPYLESYGKAALAVALLIIYGIPFVLIIAGAETIALRLWPRHEVEPWT